MENEYIKYFELKKLNVSKYYAYTEAGIMISRTGRFSCAKCGSK